MEEKGDKSLKC